MQEYEIKEMRKRINSLYKRIPKEIKENENISLEACVHDDDINLTGVRKITEDSKTPAIHVNIEGYEGAATIWETKAELSAGCDLDEHKKTYCIHSGENVEGEVCPYTESCKQVRDFVKQYNNLLDIYGVGKE